MTEPAPQEEGSEASSELPVVPFGDRLQALVAERESQLVLGVDPDPMALWPIVHENLLERNAEREFPVPAPELKAFGFDVDLAADATAFSVMIQGRLLIEATAPALVGVKFQLACFERLGQWGWRVLNTLVGCAHTLGLLTIADGKRGDIDVSAQAYAEAMFGGARTPLGVTAGLGVDCCTVNPLLGVDSLAPFVASARSRGRGLFALVHTSNPSAADLQDAPLADGRQLWERVAEIVAELGAVGGRSSGLSDVGAVMGATTPEHLARARELMPTAVFLLPGVGAQGGRIEDLAPAFAPGQAGGLIAASRSIANAYLADGGDPAVAALAEAERLRELAWRISG